MCFVCDLMGITPIEYVEVSAGVLKNSWVGVEDLIAQVPPALVPISNGFRLSPMFYN